MPNGDKKISKTEKDTEDVQEKKKDPSYVMSLELCWYIQQVMKSSSLGWFIDWQELESYVTAGLAISCWGSVFVESNFQHEGKEKSVCKAKPPLGAGAGRAGGAAAPALLRKEKGCSSNKHLCEGATPPNLFLPQCRGALLPRELCSAAFSWSSSILHPAFPCLSFPADRRAQQLEKQRNVAGKPLPQQHLHFFLFPGVRAGEVWLLSLKGRSVSLSRRVMRENRGLGDRREKGQEGRAQGAPGCEETAQPARLGSLLSA